MHRLIPALPKTGPDRGRFSWLDGAPRSGAWPTLLAVVALALAFASLGSAARSATASAAGADGTDQEPNLEVYMAAAADGARARSFPSDTRRVYVILDYKQANGERFRVRVRDLSGIIVKSEDTPPLTGDGRFPTALTASDFVASYQRGRAAASDVLRENVGKSTAKCATVPTGSEFETWRKDLLSTIESSRTATAEVTRTLQAALAIPEAAAVTGFDGAVTTASTTLAEGNTKLDQAKDKLQPSMGRPDGAAACTLIAAANTALGTGSDQAAAAINLLPADADTWRLPPTRAIYDKDQFKDCTQYTSDILALKNNQQATTATASSSWTVGDPGPPALLFQSPDQVDEAGKLNLSYANGAEAMYAQTVAVPGVNRIAHVTAFVTDAQCIPVGGAEITFSIEPSTAGSVVPVKVTLADGVAEAQITSGNEAALGKVNAVVCAGPCGEGGKQVKGTTAFDVIGPAKSPDLKINPNKVLNPLDLVESRRRALISVFPKDAFNRAVAAGTTVVVRIESGPGELAYDRTRIVNGRPTGPEQTISLGKKADLVVTDSGTTRIPPGEPGYSYGNLYLRKGADGQGKLKLEAEVDGIKQVMDYEIASRMVIFMPVNLKAHNILIPLPTATRRTPLPTETPGAASR